MSAIQAELDGFPGPPAPAGVTERTMLDALHRRYGAVLGNGRRYVVAEHVRSHASFDARRTADFVALDTWKSGKFDLHGHEVKISRSDWLRELAEPEKAGEFTPWMNRWWVVIADPSIVRPGELPAAWGLLVLRGSTLAAARTAPRRETPLLPPTRFAALMRAVQKTAAARGAK